MKEINEYINSLTIEQLVNTYKNEYLSFKETGICPDGVLRNIAKMLNNFIGSYDLRFAERLFLERCTEMFYTQNEK
jgi:hypothetical protein